MKINKKKKPKNKFACQINYLYRVCDCFLFFFFFLSFSFHFAKCTEATIRFDHNFNKIYAQSIDIRWFLQLCWTRIFVNCRHRSACFPFFVVVCSLLVAQSLATSLLITQFDGVSHIMKYERRADWEWKWPLFIYNSVRIKYSSITLGISHLLHSKYWRSLFEK